MKQADAMSKAQSAYALGSRRLSSRKSASDADVIKWRDIDKGLLGLHQDTKELLWYSRRRISRDYAASESGLGKYPKPDSSED